MPNLILPVAKKIYVCDDVVRDPASGKTSVLNICDTIRGFDGEFPIVLGKLCVFAQFRGGFGDVPIHVEIARAGAHEILARSTSFVLSFRERLLRYDVPFRIERIAFPSPGAYIVEMYCNNEFVDDQPIQVVSQST